MKSREIDFGANKVRCYFDSSIYDLDTICIKEQSVLLTDEIIHSLYSDFFYGWRTIVIKSGEENKQQSTIDEVISQLIKYGVDKGTCLIGVGGGVVTDIAGFVASIYMRGLKTGFIPTSLLGMVDACIGGKNGIDVGTYKNMLGTIRQPSFILYDFNFLKTLPDIEWSNGFAEIIKHACIRDYDMFVELEKSSINFYKQHLNGISLLIEKNVLLKSLIVQSDEFESGERKLLNFGHTIGHAMERLYKLSHGQAVSIGMMCAISISEKLLDFNSENVKRLKELLKIYSLPVSYDFDKEKIIENILFDKKRSSHEISFILLEEIGKGQIKKIPISELSQLITQLF